MPTVDVIIPTYNPTPILEKVIDNVLMQSYAEVNVILVDDASHTGADILAKVSAKKNVTFYSHRQNKGGGYARNTALEYAKSDYIAFCDADDIWAPGKLDIQLKFMEEMGISLSHSDIVPVREQGFDASRIKTRDKIDLRQSLMTTQLYCSTVCMRNSVINGNRFGTMRKRHPFKFWVSILENNIISYRVPDPDCYTNYMIREGSVSANKYATAMFTILAYIFYPKNKFLAIWCLFLRLFFWKNSRSRILGKM